MLHKILGGLFVFGLVPLGLGTVWTKGMKQKKDKLAHIYLAGFLSELAIFQVIAVPVMLTALWYGISGKAGDGGAGAAFCRGACVDSGTGKGVFQKRSVYQRSFKKKGAEDIKRMRPFLDTICGNAPVSALYGVQLCLF